MIHKFWGVKIMDKWICILICILPILMNYKSVIPGIDAATLLIILTSLIYIIVKNKGRIRFRKNNCLPLWYFVIFTVVLSAISIVLMSGLGISFSMPKIMLRCGKFIFVILSVVFVLYSERIDNNYLFKVLRIITIAAVVYQMLQILVHTAIGISLPRGIYSLLTYDVYGYDNFNQINVSFYRASSFFIEPSSFVQYVLLHLSISLFGDKEKTIKHTVDAILISISIILSGSGQGLVLLGTCWAMWYIFKVVISKKYSPTKTVLFIIVPIFLVLLFPYVYNLQIIQKNLVRISGETGLLSGYATQARLVGYEYLSDLKGIFLLIGKGYGNVIEFKYFPSVAYTIYSSGYIGIIIVGIVMIWLAIRCKSFGKFFSVLYTILIIGTTAFFGCNICFYFPFLIGDTYKYESDKKYE